MDNRLASLLQRAENLTRAEYRVLSYITGYPTAPGHADSAPGFKKLTVRKLAQETFVSSATVMRLCQKLGFSGFSELLFHIRHLLSETPTLHTQVPSPPNAEIPAAFHDFVANYQRSFEFVTAEKIQAFAQLLKQEESFFLYGTGFSHLFAEYLAKKLQLLGKTALSSGVGDSRGIFLNNAQKYRVFIAISRSGETRQVIDKAKIARSMGMKVVSFTRASANALGPLSDLNFQLFDDADNDAVDAGEITSFESNLILLIDLLLLAAIAPTSDDGTTGSGLAG